MKIELCKKYITDGGHMALPAYYIEEDRFPFKGIIIGATTIGQCEWSPTGVSPGPTGMADISDEWPEAGLGLKESNILLNMVTSSLAHAITHLTRIQSIQNQLMKELQ